MINSPESRSAENNNSTENGIAAVTKILKYNSSRVNVNEILPHWLSWLPVWEDEVEAPHVYNYLCDLTERLVLLLSSEVWTSPSHFVFVSLAFVFQ